MTRVAALIAVVLAACYAPLSPSSECAANPSCRAEGEPPTLDTKRQNEEHATIARANHLTQQAVAAANAGDCETVVTLHARVRELPAIEAQGGAEGIFLREPPILECLGRVREQQTSTFDTAAPSGGEARR